MTSLLPASDRILLGPGPSMTSPRVMRAMAAPTVGHLDPLMVAMLDDVRAKLRSEEHTSELQSHHDLVCRLLLVKKNNNTVDMGDAGIQSALQGSNVPNPDEPVPRFVSGAMAKAGNGLLEGMLQALTSAVSDKFP